MSKLSDQLPNLDGRCFKIPQQSLLLPSQVSTHPPRILMLYGSLRERSYSKLLTLEAARLLEAISLLRQGGGCDGGVGEVHTFDA